MVLNISALTDATFIFKIFYQLRSSYKYFNSWIEYLIAATDNLYFQQGVTVPFENNESQELVRRFECGVKKGFCLWCNLTSMPGIKQFYREFFFNSIIIRSGSINRN